MGSSPSASVKKFYGGLAESGLLRHGANVVGFGPTGSNPVPSSNMWMVAQLVEFWLVTPEVAGSGPVYPPTARSPSLF